MSTNVQACERCSLNIDMDTEDYTVCDGKCEKSFHAKCVGLSVEVLDALSSNILWMCDGCVEDFCRYRGRRTHDAGTNTHATIEDEIKQLQSTVAEIVDKLAKITQNEPTIPHTSTPLSSPILQDGTDEPCDHTSESEITPKTSASSNKEECGSFSLYLTHIDRCVTETDISQMVSRSLAAPLSSCYEVVKLVPRGKNINTLEYISFKIVLDTRWKQRALTSTTWPKEVKFREFVNRLNHTWKPT